VSIRVYAVATPTGYHVLPGGLARIAGDTSAEVVSNQRGGGSKDVWVLPTKRRVDGAAIQQALPRLPVRHHEVPSRVGENLFWLGRYQERCDHKLHLLRAAFNWRVDETLWQHARAACELQGALMPKVDFQAAIFDAELDIGLAADVQRLYWCATQVRARLSLDHWRAVTELRQRFQRGLRGSASLREMLDRAVMMLSALSGYIGDDMTQDLGWQLLMLGRRLERLQLLCNLLSSQLHEATIAEQGVLEWLLEISNSQVAYRRRYMSTPRFGLVMELLLSDAANPRALKFQCDALIRELLGLGEISSSAEAAEITARMNAVMDIDMGALEGRGQGAGYMRQALAAKLNALLTSAYQLSDEVALRYFAHISDSMHLVQT